MAKIFCSAILGAMESLMRTARKALGLSLEDVAHDVGISTSQLSRYETGEKDPHLRELIRIARRLGVNPARLIDVSHSEDNHVVHIKLVPVRGIAAAGLWFEYDDLNTDSFDQIPAVPTKYGGADQFAFRICGPSMDKERIFDGDYVICVHYWEARSTITSGDLVIVERKEGHKIERTCKEVVVSDDGYELWPRSTDARFQTPLRIPATPPTQPDFGLSIEIIGLVIGVYSPR